MIFLLLKDRFFQIESKSSELVGVDERERSYSRSISTPDRTGHLENRGGSATPERRPKSKHETEDSGSRRSSRLKADIVNKSVEHSAQLGGGLGDSAAPQRPDLSLADDGLWEHNKARTDGETKFLTQKSLEVDGKTEAHVDDEVGKKIYLNALTLRALAVKTHRGPVVLLFSHAPSFQQSQQCGRFTSPVCD